MMRSTRTTLTAALIDLRSVLTPEHREHLQEAYFRAYLGEMHGQSAGVDQCARKIQSQGTMAPTA